MPQQSMDSDAQADAITRRRAATRRHWLIAAVIAAGGAAGAVARYGLEVGVPEPASGFPAAILLVNALGCALIGVLMVAVERVLEDQVFVRPFLGVGVLGGFTTFSTYAVDTVRLGSDRPYVAIANLVATPVLALVAVVVGTILAELALAFVTRVRSRGGNR